MTGLLYKELRQNRLYFIITALAPIVMIWLPAFVGADGESNGTGYFSLTAGIADTAGSMPVRLLFVVFGYILIGMMASNLLSGDETKGWCYFSAATPECVKGTVYYKYLTVFMFCGIFLISCYFNETIFCSVASDITGEDVTALAGVYIMLFYLLIFAQGIELPFFVRFGAKKGGNVEAAMLVALVLIVGIYLLFGPLPDSMEDFLESVYAFIEKLTAGEVPDGFLLAEGLFPYVAIGTYLLSWKISCKLYMKGAEQFEG